MFERFNILILTCVEYMLKHWRSSVNKYFSNNDLILDCLLYIILIVCFTHGNLDSLAVPKLNEWIEKGEVL